MKNSIYAVLSGFEAPEDIAKGDLRRRPGVLVFWSAKREQNT